MATSIHTQSERVPVAVLGATGSVGQRFVTLLEGHPTFRLVALGASERSAGKPYEEAVTWALDEPLPPEAAAIQVGGVDPLPGIPLVFSALGADVAFQVERDWAAAGSLVVSNAASHRMDPRVPLIVPEINADHLELLKHSSGAGGIIAGPNCSTIGLALALAPLHRAFGVRSVHVVTLQALSGAGLGPVAGMEVPGNLVPEIIGEEDKMARELGKILGVMSKGEVESADVTLSAQCNRVFVQDGHTACVSVEFEHNPDAVEIQRAWSAFSGPPQELALPQAPLRPVHFVGNGPEPQPVLHRDLDKGMACSVGRLQECPVLGWKFVCLSHNTLRGAAGGALLIAELAQAQGLV